MFTRNTRRRNTAANTTPTAAAESLETRSLLSATASLANGTLTITGAEGGDRVTVQQYGSDQIKVLLGDGDDQLSVASNSRISADLFGGSSRDSFTGYRKDNAGARMSSFEVERWL